MKTYLLLIIICTFFVISGCKRNDDDLQVDESIICNTINQFVSEVLSNNAEKFFNKASFNILTSIDSLYLIEQNSLFSQMDIEYIFRQNRTSEDYDLSNCLRNKKLVTLETITSNPSLGYYNISAPLFSIDKEIAIVRISYFCGGLCGNGGTYIYKKENGTWRLKLTLVEWIS
jgi:hypothetical protein